MQDLETGSQTRKACSITKHNIETNLCKNWKNKIAQKRANFVTHQ